MANIAIVGSGFVGQATGKSLGKHGHNILFVDIDTDKLLSLEQEGYYVTSLENLPSKKRIEFFFLALPTPTVEGKVQVTAIEEAADTLGKYLQNNPGYPIIVLKSTVLPGTTRNVLIPRLEKSSHKKAGVDFGVVFEPEYLRQEKSLEDAMDPRLITIGVPEEEPYAGKVLGWIRSAFQCPIEYVSLEEAEMQKYVHNLLNATKISFFNEMRLVCQKLSIPEEKIFKITTESAEASWNPLYGTKNMGPFDGACLPKDTEGFLRYAEAHLGLSLPLLSATIEVNKIIESKQPLSSLPTDAYES